MLRLFIGILVAVAGAAWFWQDDLWPESEASAATVVLERPAALAGPAARGQAGSGRRVAGEIEPRLSRERSGDGQPAALGVVLDRVRSLKASGDARAAAQVLRQRLSRPAAPAAAGQLAWELARLSPDRGERRRLLGQALQVRALSGDAYAEAHEMLEALNRNPRQGLLDTIATRPYEVRPGDSLWKICNKTLISERGVHHEAGLLRLLNGMSGDTLQAGQTLLVPEQPLRLEIDRAGHGLIAWIEDVPLLAYEVGLGREDRTPTGEFVVEVKQENPTWYRNGRAIPHGDPENILGTRWMGFENQPGVMGYGIHGTERPGSIGLDESMGCVRMRNQDAEELFEIVARGTAVAIP